MWPMRRLGLKTRDPARLESRGDVRVMEHTAENDRLAVSIHANGSFDLTHKPSGRTYRSLGIFEDKGDAGDL